MRLLNELEQDIKKQSNVDVKINKSSFVDRIFKEYYDHVTKE